MAEGLGPLESLKAESQFLRGEIAAELENASEAFSKDSSQLLKHHGSYQQDDRDARRRIRDEGRSGKYHMMMVRTRIPGGLLSAEQFAAELSLGDLLGEGTIRLTTRQAIQHHGIAKGNLRELIQRINDVQLTTLAACGDVVRNVMCCPAPFDSTIYQQIQTLCDQFAVHFAPQTGAYHEIWLRESGDEEKTLVGGGSGDQEPIYGPSYLPRKFKIGIGFCHDNCVDVYTHDIGLLAVVREDEVVGYNLLVGGGMGVTPSNKNTFPALGKKIAFLAPQEVLEVAEAVVRVQRDHGNRADRKTARLKYLIHRWGLDVFRTKVEDELGRRLHDPWEDDVCGFDDHLGWHTQGNGHWFYGLNIENGRIADREKTKLKSALATICRDISPGIRLTSHQSLLLTDLDDRQCREVTAILKSHQVPVSESISAVRRWSMACVAWPTCGLAITESERALPGILDELEVELAKLGLSAEPFTIRMTGCPNGCARPYNSDIGIVGKARNKYTLFVGGQLLGKRLNFIHREMVSRDELVPVLVPLFAFFKQDRVEAETFGDFCHRQGNDRLLEWADCYRKQSH